MIRFVRARFQGAASVEPCRDKVVQLNVDFGRLKTGTQSAISIQQSAILTTLTGLVAKVIVIEAVAGS